MAPFLPPLLDPARGAREAERWGRPFQELLARRAGYARFHLDRADEARSLLGMA